MHLTRGPRFVPNVRFVPNASLSAAPEDRTSFLPPPIRLAAGKPLAASKPLPVILSASMEAEVRCFDDVHRAVQYVHDVFRQWEQANPPLAAPALLHRAKLALHEWLSNLAQHADFENHAPAVRIEIRPAFCHIHCIVEDNSAGFDIHCHLRERPGLFEGFPERGMGLQIIYVCTDNVSYDRLPNGRHRLQFRVTDDQAP